MIEGDASAGGYTHIFPGRWTPRCCVWVHRCAGRLLVNARVLQGPEDGRWLWRGREERRKKEQREEVCSPEGFKAGAGLRGSYSTSVRHTNSARAPFSPLPLQHPSPRHLPPSSFFFFCFFRLLVFHLFMHLPPSEFSRLRRTAPRPRRHVCVLCPPFSRSSRLPSHPSTPFPHSSPSLRNLLLSFRVPLLSLYIYISLSLSRAGSLSLTILAVAPRSFSRVYTLLTVINPCSVNISTQPR